jgi:hypothetical protein
MSIAQEVSKSLADRVVIAKVSTTYSSCSRFEDRLSSLQVDGELWDLERPIEKSCKLELLDFEHPEGLSRCSSLKPRNDCLRLQERRFSGTPQPTFSAKLQNGTTGVIYA